MDAELFSLAHRALAEPKRMEILESIRRLSTEEGVSCSVVLAEIDLSQATLSHHITELTKAGLISGQKVGRCNMLRVEEAVVQAYLSALREKMLGS